MSDNMHGIEDDVKFDYAAADSLVTACDGAADLLDAQRGSRQSWGTTALAEFKGHFSDLFRTNASVAAADATELGNRLRETASGAKQLKESAQKEQKRRETARAWKKKQDDRSGLDKLGDSIFGEDAPPVGPPDTPVNVPVSPPVNGTRQTPQPGSGGGSDSGTSSARPSDLESFATSSAGANDTLKARKGTARSAYDTFVAGCGWGSLDASGVFVGFDKFDQANDEDVAWARTVAGAFKQAGGDGAVSTLSNSSLSAALAAKGIDASRADIVIAPVQAVGHPPTTGYADDPVNTATGNFVETETDLVFPGAASDLVFTRTYNSLAPGIDRAAGIDAGGFGPGWNSWSESRLRFDDEAAHFLLPEGRELRFGRLDDGWDRAAGANHWLTAVAPGQAPDQDPGQYASGVTHLVSDNDGGRWEVGADGRPLAVVDGHGSVVRLTWTEDRLSALAHRHGRSVALTWDGERIAAATASDGRRIDYGYDDLARLVTATGPLGTRTYRYDDAGLVAAVVDADGVVEVDNAYDDQARVTHQRSPFGRTSRFVYLPGRITVVSDEDGTRSNTWMSDERGRLIGLVDAHEQRQSTSYDEHGNPVAVTERDGAVTVTAYDERGRAVRRVLPGGGELTWTFDDVDRLLTAGVDGELTTFAYDGDSRRPGAVTDAEGGVTRMEWADGLLTAMTDPTGVRLAFEHDPHGDLVAVRNALGHTARFEYDDAGRVAAAVSPLGARTEYEYHPDNALLAVRRDPDGGEWRFSYTDGGRMRAVVDPTGARTECEYGPHGEESAGIDALGRATVRTYDDLGNPASVRLPDGSTWTFAHDALSRATSGTDPLGATWTREYGLTGELTREVDATGVEILATTDRTGGLLTSTDGDASVALRLDRIGRIVGTQEPDGATTLTRYDRCGRPVEFVDEVGAVRTLAYDGAGRVVEAVMPGGAVRRHEYDEAGRPAAVVDENGARTTVEHDADSRVVRILHPDDTVTGFDYDVCGRLLRRHVPGVGTTRWTYDAAGRVVSVCDPQTGLRRFRRDLAGRVVQATDANGGVTRFEYDDADRVTAVVDPLGARTERGYDAVGRLVSQTDALGRTTRCGYDAAGRRTWQEDPTGVRTTWTFDAAGRTSGLVVDGVPVRRIERDVAARRLTVLTLDPDGAPAGVDSLEWDPRGLLVERARDSRVLRWAYDDAGTVASVTGPDGHTTRYDRDAVGRTVAVDHPLLGRAELVLDATGQVLEARAGGLVEQWRRADGFVVEHRSGADGTGAEQVSEVERDDDGRIVAVARDGERTRYEYDAACQLVAARTGEASVTWRYDASGRLVREEHYAAGATTTTTREYDAAGQLLVSRSGALSVEYAYDAMGRRTARRASDGTAQTCTWGVAGWLSTVTTQDADGGSRTVELRVDGLGELARAGDVELFWDATDPWNGLLQVGDRAVVPAGPFTGSGEDWFSPGWREARSGTDGDDPWEMAAVVDLPGGLSLGAAGELTLAGLEWLGARAYDASARSFLSTDPLDAEPGAAWAGNPYSYAGNDPLHALDPLGLKPVTDAELKKYAADHAGAIAAAGHWMKSNWEYVAAGAMVVAGAAVMFVPGGQAVGMGLISAGVDAGLQKFTTGKVNWTEVAISGAAGALGGGAASFAAKASEAGTMALRTTVLVNGAAGAVGSEGTYLYKNRHDLSVRGALGAAAGGFVTGGVGAASGPAGGTIAKEMLGSSSTGVKATIASTGINALGGAGGNIVDGVVSGDGVSLKSAAVSGVVGAGVSHLAGKIPGQDVPGTRTLKEMSNFGVRTSHGLTNFSAPGTRTMYTGVGVGGVVGATFDLSGVGDKLDKLVP